MGYESRFYLLCLFTVVILACAVAASQPCTAAERTMAYADGSLPSVPHLRVKVTALRQTVLSSQMAGRIESLAVFDGDAFTKGQSLVRMECAVPAAQLAKAQANAQKNNALHDAAKSLEKLNSRSRLDVAVARSEAAQAAAEVAVAQSMLGRCQIFAPFSGRVGERMAQEGQFVNEGQPLLEILDPTSLELEFIVPSHWLPWFIPGYSFTVRIDETHNEYQAELIRLSGKVDAVSQSIKAYARFLTPDPTLLPGMSGEALVAPPVRQE